MIYNVVIMRYFAFLRVVTELHFPAFLLAYLPKRYTNRGYSYNPPQHKFRFLMKDLSRFGKDM